MPDAPVTLIPYASRIQFGFGARETLEPELALLGVKRALLVTDHGVVASGVCATALEFLDARLIAATFDGVTPNPTQANVDAALALYREASCDGIIAVGGGSSIDCAKAVALMATHDGVLSDYRALAGGTARITPRVAPVIALPTTAGTGSEIARGLGISLADGEKASFNSLYLIPRVAICDPELTLTLPVHLTSSTGVDALSHCIEGYLSKAINPPADAVALDGIERLMEFLPRAVHKASDRDARWNVMMGAVEGGMSILRGLGPAHALSIPLDAFELHHGTLVGVLLPQSVAFVFDAIPKPRLDRLARAMGCARATDIPDRLRALNRDIGLPTDLAGMNIADDALPEIAEAAAKTVFNLTSSRTGTAGEYLAYAREAMLARA